MIGDSKESGKNLTTTMMKFRLVGMTGIERVADRMHKEIGLSHATSLRITRKLSRLAESVAWARPVLATKTTDKKAKSSVKFAPKKSKARKKSQGSHR